MSRPREASSAGENDAALPVEALFTVAGGAAVVVAATVSGMLLMLAGRGLFTRAFEPGEYGLFSLAFTVTSILTVVATLGLRNGIPRQVAFHNSHASEAGLTPASIITWGFLATLLASGVVCVVLWLGAPFLAHLFGHPEYTIAFRVAAVSVPGLALIRSSTAVYRGFNRTRERVVFQELLQKGSFPLLLSIVVYSQAGLVAALLAFPTSLFLTAVAYSVYTLRFDPGAFREKVVTSIGRPSDGYELLAFSFPLLFASLLIQIMTWTDILMLGYFKTATEVGIYDAVRPLVELMAVIWGGMIFLYTPIASGLTAEEAMESIRRVYFALTKWFASLTFPFAITFLLFPDLVLRATFGAEYAVGAVALQVLAVAFFLGHVMGPNGATLTALGHTRVLMWANLVAAIANIILNVWLIPAHGIVGAALATATALVVRNLIRVGIVYVVSGAHSFQRPMLVPMGITVVAGIGTHVFVSPLITSPLQLLPVVVALLVVYGASLVSLGFVSEADRALLAWAGEQLPLQR